jgi:hypothetical protein
MYIFKQMKYVIPVLLTAFALAGAAGAKQFIAEEFGF